MDMVTILLGYRSQQRLDNVQKKMSILITLLDKSGYMQYS